MPGDGDKDAIEDANEVWELAMQKDKRPTLCFGINTCFLEEFVRQLQSRACFKNHKLLTMMVFS